MPSGTLVGVKRVTDAIWTEPRIIAWSQRLLRSFHHWTGRWLLPDEGTPVEQAHRLFVAPYVVVSHGLEDDPILNYGNQAALDLWELSWEALTRLPSRLTAEPMEREERARLLRLVEAQGYFDRYRGVRVSATGRRFLVETATVWNVLDEQGRRVGQAATFETWTRLD